MWAESLSALVQADNPGPVHVYSPCVPGGDDGKDGQVLHCSRLAPGLLPVAAQEVRQLRAQGQFRLSPVLLQVGPPEDEWHRLIQEQVAPGPFLRLPRPGSGQKQRRPVQGPVALAPLVHLGPDPRLADQFPSLIGGGRPAAIGPIVRGPLDVGQLVLGNPAGPVEEPHEGPEGAQPAVVGGPLPVPRRPPPVQIGQHRGRIQVRQGPPAGDPRRAQHKCAVALDRPFPLVPPGQVGTPSLNRLCQ
jgi:hypothetical protein